MELTYCENCKKFFYPASIVKTADTGEAICLSCARYYDEYKQCDECGQFFNAGNTMMTATGDWGYVCPQCYNRYNYTSCYECGDVFRENEMIYDTTVEDYFCPDCNPSLDFFEIMYPIGAFA